MKMVSTSLFAVALSIGMILNITQLVILIREKRIKDPFKMVLLSLAIADFLTLLLATVVACAWIAFRIRLDNAFDILFPSAIVSQFHIIIITFQRIVAVTLPLRFKSLITSHRCFTALIIIWLFTVSLSAVLLTMKADLAVNILIYLLFGCGVFLFISYKFIIYRVLKDRRRVNPSRAASLQNKKLIVYSLSVTVAFICCNYPFAVRTIINNGENVQSVDNSLESLFFFLNPVVDPVIYLLLHECKSESRVHCCLRFKNRVEEEPPNRLLATVGEHNGIKMENPTIKGLAGCSHISSTS